MRPGVVVAAVALIAVGSAPASAFQNARPLRATASKQGAIISPMRGHARMRVGKLGLPATARVSTRSSARAVFGSLRASAVSNVEAAQLRLDAIELLEVGGLTAEEVNKLLSIADIRLAKPGDVMKQSDAITSSAYEDKVLFIVSGSADILEAGEVARGVGPGDFVGESEYLQLEVTEKLQVLSVDPVQQFFDLAGSHQSIFLEFARRLSNNSHAAPQQIRIRVAQWIRWSCRLRSTSMA